MKRFLFFLSLLLSLQSFAYDMETDGGATDHILTQARWNAAVSAIQSAGGGVIYFHGTNWVITATDLGVPSNVIVEGNGKYITTLRFSQSLTTSTSNNGFIAIGASHVTFRNLRILSGAKRLNAVFKFNSMGANAATECKGIYFINVNIDSSYANGIKMGETAGLANGESHHFRDVKLINCEIGYLGNPSALYTTIDNAPQESICTGFKGNQTTWDWLIQDCWIHDCSGDGVNNNLTGWTNSAGFVVDSRIGAYVMRGTTIENTYSNLGIIGNWGYGMSITDNHFRNPTGAGCFNETIEGSNGVVEGNICETWQGRNAVERYGSGNTYNDKIVVYLADHPIVATRRTDSRPTTQMELTGGFQNRYYDDMRYDASFGISSNLPVRRSGIHICNKSQPGYQPPVFDGRDYAFGFDIHAKIRNCTGPSVYGEIQTIADVSLQPDCIIQSSVMTEDAVRIAGPRWKIMCQVDGSGSSTDVWAVSVDTARAGKKFNDGFVHPQITNWGNKWLKQGSLYNWKPFDVTPPAAVSKMINANL